MAPHFLILEKETHTRISLSKMRARLSQGQCDKISVCVASLGTRKMFVSCVMLTVLQEVCTGAIKGYTRGFLICWDETSNIEMQF
jgi:hypothetical protein